MAGRVVRRERAKQDLIECADYLEQEAGDKLDERFLTAAESTFNKLAKNPEMGWPRKSPVPELQAVRTWHVDGFDHHLVFYEPIDDGVRVLRVLHGKRDRLDDLIQPE